MRFPDFERLGVSVAAFSDKTDGDLSFRTSCDPAAVLLSRRQFCTACGVETESLVCAQQVHGTHVANVTNEDRGRGALNWDTALPDTDGLITGARGLPVAVLVADCAPVFLYDPIAHVGGLVHAGRRGVFDNICARTVERLVCLFNAVPGHIHALIGPSAGPCCYEVSSEIALSFARAGLAVSGRKLDLWAAIAQQLTATGISEDHITQTHICTICDGRFHSHRADVHAGRNMALLML